VFGGSNFGIWCKEGLGAVKDLVFSLELRRDAKKGVDETPLPDHIALRQPTGRLAW
jgi:hypothetical protein